MRKKITALLLAMGMLLDLGGMSEVVAAEQRIIDNEMQESVVFSTYAYGSGLKHDPKYENYKKINGIDVSKWQKEIDWEKVKKSGIDFAIIRVGNRWSGSGQIALDPYFVANIEGAHKAGVDIGVYFYTQAITQKEAREEAQFVVKQLKPYAKWINYPVYYDLESTSSDRIGKAKLNTKQKTQLCKAFCDTINENGYVGGIYTYYLYYLNQLNMDELKDYDIWLARSSNEPSYKGKLFPYDYSMWQYYCKGKVDGIKGNVDMDIYYVKSAPEKVTGLKQTEISDNTMTLVWNASSYADGYEIVRMDRDGKVLSTIKTTETQYSLEDLSNGWNEKFKVRAYSVNSNGAYTYGNYSSGLNVRTLPEKVESVLQTESNSTFVTIEWNTVSDADGYRIRKYDPETKKYTTIDTITDTSYTVTGLEPKNAVQIVVQAYVKINGSTKKYGTASELCTIVSDLKKVEDIAVENLTEDMISIIWEGQDDISGYEVSCYDEESQLISSDCVMEEEYTKKNLEIGKEYQFTVRSYLETKDGTKMYGPYSDLCNLKTLPQKVTGLISKDVEDTSLMLTWDAVTGADGYCVYAYDTKKKKDTLLQTVTETSCEIKELLPSTTYNYRVAAYVEVQKENYCGALSSTCKVVTQEAKPVKPLKVKGMKVIKAGKNSVTFSWEAQDKVSGYRVYLYDKNIQKGKFFKATSKNRFTLDGLKPGTEYCVRVKAYHTVNGSTLYGKASNVLVMKTK